MARRVPGSGGVTVGRVAPVSIGQSQRLPRLRPRPAKTRRVSKFFINRPNVAVVIAIVLVLAGAVSGEDVKTRHPPLCSPLSRLVL